MRRSDLAGALALGLILAGCQQPAAPTAATPAAVDTAQDAQAIEADEVQWATDYKSKDLEKVIAHYADDAVAMFPAAPVMSGKAAIRQNFGPMLQDPAFALDFKNEKTLVAASGDLAYTRGTFTMTATDPATKKPVTQTGSYLTVFRKQADGSWKAIEDIGAPGAPAPPASTAAN